MHKALLLLFTALLNLGITHAQLFNQKVENKNIQQFIQIWGLVKYRSQKSITGQFDADKTFLELIDSVKNADKTQFNALMLKLTQDIGPKSIDSKQVYPKSKLINGTLLINNADYHWVKNRKFSSELRTLLDELTNKINTTGKHQYIPEIFYEGELTNEEPYKNYTFDKEAMNLLALAKAWNAIEYLFPYKYVMDNDWKDILAKMVPYFRTIHDQTTYEKGILMLAVAINDTHAAAIMSPESMQTINTIFNVRYYPPFDYKATEKALIIKQFLNDSLANISSLKPGDEIVAINGITTKKWLKERATLLPASNNAVIYRALSTTNNARGDAFAFSNIKSNTVQVKVNRQGRKLNLSIRLLDRKDKQSVQVIANHINKFWTAKPAKKGVENLGDDITLISAGYLFDKDLPDDEAIPELAAELKSKKALIFDMRAYPQSPGFFSYYLQLLLGKDPFAFARYYAVDLRQVGLFKYQEKIETYMRVPENDAKPKGELYTGKIVILTNENTQSMGEWFTMMLSQFNQNTTIIGSQTAGADGDVKRMTLPGNYQFSFTGNGIFYPDGSETQRIGITPDIYFEPSAKDLSSTTDAHLQRAIHFIRTGK